MSRQEGRGGIGEFSVDEAPKNLRAEFFLGLTFVYNSNWVPRGQIGCMEDLLAKSSYQVFAEEEECLFVDDSFLLRARKNLVSGKRKLEMVYMAKLGVASERELGLVFFADLEPVYRTSLARFGIEMGAVVFQLSFPDGMAIILSFVKGGVMITLNKRGKASEIAYSGGRWLNFIVHKKFAHYLKPEVVEVPPPVWLSLMGSVMRGELTGQTEVEIACEIEKKLFESVAAVSRILGK